MMELCPFCASNVIAETPTGGGTCIQCGAEADEWNRRDLSVAQAKRIEWLNTQIERKNRVIQGKEPPHFLDMRGLFAETNEDKMKSYHPNNLNLVSAPDEAIIALAEHAASLGVLIHIDGIPFGAFNNAAAHAQRKEPK